MKKIITLEAMDPIEIFGAGNKIIEEFCSYFPGLKVVARGNQIRLDGDSGQIEQFSGKLEELIERRRHKMNLTKFDVEDIFDGETSPDSFRLNGDAVIVHGTDGKPVRARNKTQQELVKAYFNSDLVFAAGPAGTGKTYIAIALAVRALKNREIKRIILTRPAVEAGERLGFLPGDMKDKLDPYLQPLYDALGDMIPSKKLQEFISDGTIQIAPLAYMRGRTLDRACVILDEAQNTNLGQLKMFLTRMGPNAKFIVTGDASQVDLPRKEDSGFLKGISLLKDIKGVSTICFTSDDIVRHPLVTKIVKAFDKEEKINKEEKF
ncbi:MAG: PhoH family protein [Candidatus Cryptobacteroides sp.]|nr:PhoH family protein [Bacteroidales bacterium]